MRPRTKEICWAVWNPRLGIYFGSISDTRSTAIVGHLRAPINRGSTWRRCYRNGDRAVKIRIEILEPSQKRRS